jgi:hypothetical protein
MPERPLFENVVAIPPHAFSVEPQTIPIARGLQAEIYI